MVRTEVGARRKVIHLLIGAVFIVALLQDDRSFWFFIAVLCFGIALSLLQERRPIKALSWVLERYDKSNDKVPGQGPITFFLGALLAWSIFPERIALAAIIVLTFGDGAAFVVGRFLGRHKLPWNERKTIEGSTAFVLFPFILISLAWGPLPAILLSVAGALVESIEWPDSMLTDDNILVPLASGAAGALLTLVV